MKLAKRMDEVKESATLAITAKAKSMKAKGWDVIDFGAGEPDFDTPDNIKEAAIKAIKSGFTKYTAVGGIDELKDAIIEKFKRDNNLNYTREEILVSCGGKQSFFNLSLAFFEKGDEVIIPAPYWVSYPVMVAISGAKPVIIEEREDNGFKITPEEFSDAITGSTKAIVINSPSNPTGAAYTPDELKEIADIAVKKGVFLVSDEIYEKLCYDNHPFVSIASFSEEVKRQTIVLNGVSKTYSMTGWRIGYAAGPKGLIKAMTNIQSQSTSNPTSISQKAAVEAIKGPQDTVDKMVTEFDKRRKIIVDGLNAIKGIRCLLPPGSFYVFPNISRFLKKRFNGKIINTSADFADFLLEEAEVAVVPGEAFGGEGHIRMAYATSMENIKEGLKRIEEAVTKLE
ncbi:MAG: aspartate aminotransferase [Deltaproteobacteria bacterium GWA2_42_85]|nr:MAG: aspartate aminotransferase [Deltaproteobacteria bacterium GWA2_42_85]OGP24823.1 MAG: aspartate aminotransferase [Deltaproteobacteria bacterium GWB2_42_7]OGP47737.1 MAG: aspartate aminotransferase [Deltaproteobacteria bacterium GWF2_42_12]OGQ29724.1 MAG: aspartate aminotransferase [Deltaproteobacteria bacterium RIFCSPHIGHO2_02_FULL_42_44]OGQ35221.1 MAG: aspartate aminotransferase [Deltaproteobacteria bacterium RIFCSPLOWO2_02_FULL_42_39]OGQ64724.1 MAG: aspartate aminotransferase [Deltapr